MAYQNTDSHSASQREDGIVAQKKRQKKKKAIGEKVAKLQGNELKVEGGRKRGRNCTITKQLSFLKTKFSEKT